MFFPEVILRTFFLGTLLHLTGNYLSETSDYIVRSTSAKTSGVSGDRFENAESRHAGSQKSSVTRPFLQDCNEHAKERAFQDCANEEKPPVVLYHLTDELKLVKYCNAGKGLRKLENGRTICHGQTASENNQFTHPKGRFVILEKVKSLLKLDPTHQALILFMYLCFVWKYRRYLVSKLKAITRTLAKYTVPRKSFKKGLLKDSVTPTETFGDNDDDELSDVVGNEFGEIANILSDDDEEYHSCSESLGLEDKGDHLALVKDSNHDDGISVGQKPVTSPDQHLDINLSLKDHSPQTSCEQTGVEASPNNKDHPTSLMEAKCRERCSPTNDGCPVAPLGDCHTGRDENLDTRSNDSQTDIANHVAPPAGTPNGDEKDSPSRDNVVSKSADAQMLHDVIEVTNTQRADASKDVPLITSKVDKKDEMLKDQTESDAELLESDDEFPDEFFVVGSELCILTADDWERIDPAEYNSSSESPGLQEKGDHLALVKDSKLDDGISDDQKPVTSPDQHLDMNLSQKDHSPQTSCEQPGVEASPNNKDHPTSLMEAKCRERCSQTGDGCPVAPLDDCHTGSDENLVALSNDSHADDIAGHVAPAADYQGTGTPICHEKDSPSRENDVSESTDAQMLHDVVEVTNTQEADGSVDVPLITSKVDKKDEMLKDQTGSDAELLKSDDEYPDEFFVVGSEFGNITCILTADDCELIDPGDDNSSSESAGSEDKGDHFALVKDSNHDDAISGGQRPVTSSDQHLDINVSQKDHSPQTSCEQPGVKASPNNKDHPTSLMEAKCRERCSQTGDGCPVAPLDDCHTGSDENLVALSNDSHADDIASHVAPAADYQGAGTPICHEKDSPSRENDVSESTDAQMLHDVVEVTNTQEADGSVDVPLITSKVDKKDEMLKDQRGSDAELLESDDEYPDDFFVVGSEFGNITCILTADDCELIDPGDDNSSSESAGSEDKGDHFALVKDSNHDDAISGGQRPVTSSDQHLDINFSQKDHSRQTSCEQPGVKASPNNKDHPASLMEAKCRERCSQTGDGCPVAPLGDCHTGSDENLVPLSNDSHADDIASHVAPAADYQGAGTPICHEKDSPSRENDVSESTDAQMLHDVVEVTNTQEADGSVDVPLITSKVDKKDEMLKDQRGSDAELLESNDEFPDEFFVVGSEFGNITCILTADDCELIDPGDNNSSSESAGSEDKGDHFALVKDSNHDDGISDGQRPVISSDQHLDINRSQKDHSPQTSCEQPGVKASPNNKDHPTSLMEAKCRERCSKTGGGCPVAPPGDRHADSDQNLIAWSCDSQVDGCKCVVVSCGDGDGDGHGDCDDDGDGVGDGDGHGDGDGIVVTRSGHSKADNGGNVVVLSGGSHGDGSGSVLARSCNNKADGDESVVVSGSSHGDGAGSEVVTPVESQAGSGESVVASSGDSETGSGGSVVASSGDSKTDIDANVVALSVGREVGDNGRHTALPSDGTEEIPVLEVEMEQNDLRPDTTISKTTDQVQTRNEDQSLSLNKETCRECDSQIDDGNLVDLLEDQNDKMTGSVQHKECELGEPTGELEDEAINKLGNKASEAPPRDKDLSSCSTCRDGSDGRVIASLCEHLPGQEGSPIAELSNQCDVHSVEGGNRESSTNSNDETITNFTQPKSWKQDCLPPKNVVILSSKGQRESNEITRETEHSVGELSGKNTTGIGSSATTGDAYEYTSTMEIENRPVENLFGICAFDDLPKTGCNSGVHEDTQPEDRQVHAPVDCGNIKEQGNDGFTNEFVLVTNPDGQTKSLISTKDLHPNDLDQVDDDDDFPDEFFLFSVPNNENKSLIPTEYLHPEDIVSYGSEDGEDVFSEGQFPNPLCNPIDFDGVRVERREEIWLDSQYDGGDNEDGIQLPENLADHEFISGSENTSQEYAWGKIMKSVHNYGKGSLFLIGAFVLPCVIAAKVLK